MGGGDGRVDGRYRRPPTSADGQDPAAVFNVEFRFSEPDIPSGHITDVAGEDSGGVLAQT